MKSPANLALLLEGFFTQRLMAQRHASPHTMAPTGIHSDCC
jgi:hypothetical protein